MNEKGASNRGDGVYEELPHQSDNAHDGRCCLVTGFWIIITIVITVVAIIIIKIEIFKIQNPVFYVVTAIHPS